MIDRLSSPERSMAVPDFLLMMAYGRPDSGCDIVMLNVGVGKVRAWTEVYIALEAASTVPLLGKSDEAPGIRVTKNIVTSH